MIKSALANHPVGVVDKKGDIGTRIVRAMQETSS